MGHYSKNTSRPSLYTLLCRFDVCSFLCLFLPLFFSSCCCVIICCFFYCTLCSAGLMFVPDVLCGIFYIIPIHPNKQRTILSPPPLSHLPFAIFFTHPYPFPCSIANLFHRRTNPIKQRTIILRQSSHRSSKVRF